MQAESKPQARPGRGRLTAPRRLAIVAVGEGAVVPSEAVHGMNRLILIAGALAALTGTARAMAAPASDGRVHVTYWDKWSGREEAAMQEVVDAYNRSQDRVEVDFLSVGLIQQKTLLAIAGGDPPDIAGLFLDDVCPFADRSALLPLGPLMRAQGGTEEQFLGRYAAAYGRLGVYAGETWAVPSTPTTLALYWNKDVFRAAGLDPERPPRTLDELDAMSRQLAHYDAAGNLDRIGFLPDLESGWAWSFPEWFGGQLFDGKEVVIGRDPAAGRAFAWTAGWSGRYGVGQLRRLSGTFGTLASAQDPFISGRVAMVIDGVWRGSFIREFAPGLDYGVAGWPAAVPGVDDFTVAEADMLAIPRGAKHPREAWDFIAYLSSPNLAATRESQLSGVELLCYRQEKESPLTQWSPFFRDHHPNAHIDVFRKLAESPHAVSPPKMGTWNEYMRRIDIAFDQVRLQLKTPAGALSDCQRDVAASWEWHRESLDRRRAADALTAAPTTP
jgi:ABC-type glycerol-3-phosphate transport system substrate-binding protein